MSSFLYNYVYELSNNSSLKMAIKDNMQQMSINVHKKDCVDLSFLSERNITVLSDRICTNSQSHESIFAGKHGKIVR